MAAGYLLPSDANPNLRNKSVSPPTSDTSDTDEGLSPSSIARTQLLQPEHHHHQQQQQQAKLAAISERVEAVLGTSPDSVSGATHRSDENDDFDDDEEEYEHILSLQQQHQQEEEEEHHSELSDQNRVMETPTPKGSRENEQDYADIQQIGGNMFNQVAMKSGYLHKKAEKRKTWKKRYFVLRPDRLCYYKDDKEYQIIRHIPISEVHACAQVSMKHAKNSFGIVTPKRTYYVHAESQREADDWVSGINTARQAIDDKMVNGLNDAEPVAAASASASAPAPPVSQNISAAGKAGDGAEKVVNVRSSSIPKAERRMSKAIATSVSPASDITTVASDLGLKPIPIKMSTTSTAPGTPGFVDSSGSFHHNDYHLHNQFSSSYASTGTADTAGDSSEVPTSLVGLATFSSSEEDDDFPLHHISSPNTDHTTISTNANNNHTIAPNLPPISTSSSAVQPLAAHSHRAFANAEPNTVIMNGYLMKQGKRKTWRKRWFTLTSQRLMYARSHIDSKVNRSIPLDQILDVMEYAPPPARGRTASTAATTPSATTLTRPIPGEKSIPSDPSQSNGVSHPSASTSSTSPAVGIGGGSITAAAAVIGSGSRGGNSSSSIGGGSSGTGKKQALQNCFKIITPSRTFLISAPTEEEEIHWLSAMRVLINANRKQAGPSTITTPTASVPLTSTTSSSVVSKNVTSTAQNMQQGVLSSHHPPPPSHDISIGSSGETSSGATTVQTNYRDPPSSLSSTPLIPKPQSHPHQQSLSKSQLQSQSQSTSSHQHEDHTSARRDVYPGIESKLESIPQRS